MIDFVAVGMVTIVTAIGTETIVVVGTATRRAVDMVIVVDSDTVNLDLDSSMNCSPNPEILVVCTDRSMSESCFCY